VDHSEDELVEEFAPVDKLSLKPSRYKKTMINLISVFYITRKRVSPLELKDVLVVEF
jgi:hypothetical protein